MQAMTAPNNSLLLRFELLSAATFGRGVGLPGDVDQEVEHDAYGMPYLRGRALRGLLAEEAKSILFALGEVRAKKWQPSLMRLFGEPGRMMDDPDFSILKVSDAQLPENLHRLIAYAIEEEQLVAGKLLTADEVLNSLTAIRRQTAMTHLGAPEAASLRAMRVVLRETRFEARLTFSEEPAPLDLALLTATTLAWRRVGTGRNRGRGRVRAWLKDEEWTRAQFDIFRQEVASS